VVRVLAVVAESDGSARKLHAPPRVRASQGTTGAEPEDGEGVGGLNKSDDAGEPMARDPAEQRQPVPQANYRSET